MPSTFFEDLNQISIKTEKALSRIKNLKNFLSKDNKKIFGKKSENNLLQILDSKIERLKYSINSISDEIEKQELIIDRRYQKEENNIYESIIRAKESRKKYRENYEKNKELVKGVVGEVLRNLN